MDVDRAAALYRGGMSLAEVAAELGMAPSGVDEQLRKAGVPMRRQGAPRMDVDDDWIVQLRDGGLSWRDVSDTVGMTMSGVRSRYSKAMAAAQPAPGTLRRRSVSPSRPVVRAVNSPSER